MDIIEDLLHLTNIYKHLFYLKIDNCCLSNKHEYILLNYLINKLEEFEYSLVKEGEEIQDIMLDLNKLNLINIEKLTK